MREALTAIFGGVDDDLAAHASDRTENEPRMPGFVVKASRPEQVGELLALANERGVPVTPKVTGMNIGGLAIPAEGGIVLDLSALTGIEIDAAHGVAWIEPGVTWEQLKAEAAKHDLALGFPLAPPDTSVLACALMDGLNTMSCAHGSLGEWVTSVDVYLADGTKVVTGSAAMSGRPLSRGPLPDLTGMFINWFGSTGIAVRLGFQLWPKRKFKRRDVVSCTDLKSAFDFMRAAARTGLYDDVAGLGWPAAKWALGIDNLGPRDPHEPLFYIVVEYGADSRSDIEHRRKTLAQLAPTAPLAVEDLIQLAPDLETFAELPARFGFLLDHEGGGLTWVGTYGPMDKLEEGAQKGIDLMDEAGYPPLMVCRPMKGGHYAVLRFIERFDRTNEEETSKIRDLNVRLGRTLMELGYVPYKCPAILYEDLREHLDPGFLGLMKRMKQAIDPKGILNPDRWRL